MSHQRLEHDLTNTLSPHACGQAPIALPSGPGAASGEIFYAEVYVPVEEVTSEPAPDSLLVGYEDPAHGVALADLPLTLIERRREPLYIAKISPTGRPRLPLKPASSFQLYQHLFPRKPRPRLVNSL